MVHSDPLGHGRRRGDLQPTMSFAPPARRTRTDSGLRATSGWRPAGAGLSISRRARDELRYDQQAITLSGRAGPAQQWGQQPGAQGYDLGNYMPRKPAAALSPRTADYFQQGQYPAEYGHPRPGLCRARGRLRATSTTTRKRSRAAAGAGCSFAAALVGAIGRRRCARLHLQVGHRTERGPRAVGEGRRGQRKGADGRRIARNEESVPPPDTPRFRAGDTSAALRADDRGGSDESERSGRLPAAAEDRSACGRAWHNTGHRRARLRRRHLLPPPGRAVTGQPPRGR